MKYAVSNNPNINNIINNGNSFIKNIEDKIKDQMNNYCVECGEENPEYISINNGIFLCRICVQNHIKFPKCISRIKKNNIKSLTLNEIQYLLCGGNRSLLNFICNEYPKLAELPSNILYRTQAMIYYRQNLQYLINGTIPPIKPSIKSAYSIPNIFSNLDKNNICNNYEDKINKNGLYTNYENRDLLENSNKFNKTGYYFRPNGKNLSIKSNQNSYKKDKNRLTISNTIGNKDLNYDNYFINRQQQVNFQTNNIMIGSKMEFINSIHNNKNKTSILHSNEKMDINKKNIHEYLNNININNINTDVYMKPKLILSHNVSKNYLINKNESNQRETSFENPNKKYYYSQANSMYGKSKIDSIQLNFTKDINNSYFKRKLNKNLSHEIYKKSKRCIKSNKYLHKSFSQKLININNNDTSYYKNINKENCINKNYIIIHSDNSQFVPTKNLTINYAKSQNDYSNICITNNEEFQIIPKRKTIDISINKNGVDYLNKENNNEKNEKKK